MSSPQIRFLHGRCLRLESCRKALVWQKRYLQRVLTGYTELEKTLRLPRNERPNTQRFKCVATAVVAVLRMEFLVRRRQHVRALSATCILRAPEQAKPAKCVATAVVAVLRMEFLVRRLQHVRALSATCILRAPEQAKPANPPQYMGGSSPPSRDRAAPSAVPSSFTPGPAFASNTTPYAARRVMKQDLRLNMPASPMMGDMMRRSPFVTNSPREDPFMLSSPRGEMAAAYLNKLELVSRCLNHAMEGTRDAP
ncbi:sporulation-specific protein 15 isoform X1 [Phthorimaea operculella]|nr:sporulation-specific protein 15 isoform X1 [Phthorimaea operculella]